MAERRVGSAEILRRLKHLEDMGEIITNARIRVARIEGQLKIITGLVLVNGGLSVTVIIQGRK